MLRTPQRTSLWYVVRSSLICKLANQSQLSDGLCASACTIFMEMMHWDAGVKNVVVGGRPSYGPMQTPSGSRGARFYDLGELDNDIANVVAINTLEGLPADPRIPDRGDQTIYVLDAGVSLRAQVREGETVPLQMQFEAADCRIFYTPSTFNNFTNLWIYAADAWWTNQNLCVRDSIGYATGKNTTPKPAPSAVPLAAVSYSDVGIPNLHHPDAAIDFLVSDLPLPDGSGPNEVRPETTTDKFYQQINFEITQKNAALQAGGRHVSSGKLNRPRVRGCQPTCGVRGQKVRRSRGLPAKQTKRSRRSVA